MENKNPYSTTKGSVIRVTEKTKKRLKKEVKQAVKKITRKRSKKIRAIIIIVLIVLYAVFAAVVSLNEHFFKNEAIPTWKELYEMSGFSAGAHTDYGDFAVHFIDVDQGDCALITAGDYTVLIDAGEVSQKSKVLTYLRSLDIDSLDMISHLQACVKPFFFSDHTKLLRIFIRRP